MQSSHRSSGGGFRPPFGFRNRGRGGFSFGRGRWGFGRARGGFARGRTRPYSPPAAQPPPSGDNIFMQAGRLAAEFLVSKGLLPPSTLPPNQELRVPSVRGRINYIGRGGRGRGRGRGRYGSYGRGFDYDGGRGTLVDRARRCPEAMEEGEIGEFDEVGSSESGVHSDERDSGIKVYDTGSKPSSFSARMDSLALTSTRVDPMTVVEVDMNDCNAVGEDPLAVTEVAADGDAELPNSESGDGKNGLSGDPKKRRRQSLEEADINVQPCGNEFDDRLELGSFAEASKKLRSSGA